MKKLTFLLIWAALLLPVKESVAQCEPPVNPIALINTFEGFGQIEWGAPTHPCIDLQTLYYEMEIGYFPFSPGMGQGMLVTPLYGTFHSLPSMNFNGIQIWLRTVCDCTPTIGCCTVGGSGDGAGAWVMVTIIDLTPPCYSGPGAVCGTAPAISISTAENCEQSFGEELYYCGYVGQTMQSAPNNACSVSSNEGYFEWRKFTAPSSGAVSINVSGMPFNGLPAWNDFGYRIVETNCNGSLVHCEPAVTSENTVSVEGLTSGTQYYIGVWNNNYNYNPEYTVFNKLTICEAPEICVPPTDLNTTDATDESVMVHWSANGSEMWDLEYGTEGFTPGAGNVIEGIEASPYLLSGLEPVTVYDAYLKSICESGALSTWVGPVTFETGVPTFQNENAFLIQSIFPNPTSGHLNILLNENGPVVIELFGMHGQQVLVQNHTASAFDLNLSHLAKGMYSIRLTTSQQTITDKLILK